MRRHRRRIIRTLLLAFLGFGVSLPLAACAVPVERSAGRIYIVDRHGERWDITQAVSLGFRPDAFQYGIGRYAFTPLDDSGLRDAADTGRSDERVIGIAVGGEAKAYSVPRLTRHEIANSRIGGKAVAAAY